MKAFNEEKKAKGKQANRLVRPAAISVVRISSREGEAGDRSRYNRVSKVFLRAFTEGWI